MCRMLKGFARGEEGGITALSLQIFVSALVMGGLAVDFGKGVAARTQLQVAADAAAHAAIVTRDTKDAKEAKAVALNLAALNMPSGTFGNVLTADNIRFGHWDRDRQVFTADAASRDAVLVSTEQTTANGNGVSTYMMELSGRGKLDVTAGTVFEAYYPACFREGFVARDRLDVQSGNTFAAGFCVHSQDHVSVASNNRFEPGVVVSMPDSRDIARQGRDQAGNTGLAEALRDGSFQMKILARIGDIIRGIETSPSDPDIGVLATTSKYYRPYITSALPISIDATGSTALDPSKFRSGRIHVLDCRSDNSPRQIGAGFTLKNMVLITDCRLQFNAGAAIEDAVIISTNSGDAAFHASSDTVIGRNDHCGNGGDVQMVTLGGVDFASGTSIFGSQIIAAGDISLAAGADGMEGVALVAGGRLDVASSGAFGFCNGAGMNNNYAAAYFRLAR